MEGYTRGCQKEHFGGQLMAKRKVFRKSFWQKVLTFLGGLGAAETGHRKTDGVSAGTLRTMRYRLVEPINKILKNFYKNSLQDYNCVVL